MKMRASGLRHWSFHRGNLILLFGTVALWEEKDVSSSASWVKCARRSLEATNVSLWSAADSSQAIIFVL